MSASATAGIACLPLCEQPIAERQRQYNCYARALLSDGFRGFLATSGLSGAAAEAMVTDAVNDVILAEERGALVDRQDAAHTAYLKTTLFRRLYDARRRRETTCEQPIDPALTEWALARGRPVWASEELLSPEELVLERAVLDVVIVGLNEAFDALDSEERCIAQLLLVEGKSLAAAGAELGYCKSHTGRLLERVREKLQAKLSAAGVSPGEVLAS